MQRFEQWRRAAVVALALTFALLGGLYAQNYDFRAFYCAGAVARQGADPYTTQPLYNCELHRTWSNPRWNTNGVLPAPFPGYVIGAIFQPISTVPYAVASRVWTFLLLLALLGCISALRVVTKASLLLVAAVLCLSVTLSSVQFGEIAPLFLLFLCLTMVFLQRSSWAAAALCSAGCLIEPHIGGPVCIALACWVPRSRIPLLVCGVALAGLSIIALGIPGTVEYFTRVLPYHAASELGTDRQLSLSSVLYSLGVNAQWSLRLGSWSYFALLPVGIIAARRLAQRFNDPAYIAAVPAAVSLLGGVFLHVTQMVAAIPLAMLLLRDVPQRRWAIAVALALLAIPFTWIANGVLFWIAAIVAIAIIFEASDSNVWWRTVQTLVPLAFLATLAALPAHPPVAAPAWHVAQLHIDPRYAEYDWAVKNTQYLSSNFATSWVQRIPEWLALLTIFGVAILVFTTRKRALPNILTNTSYEMLGSTSDA